MNVFKKNLNVADMKNGDAVEGFYLLKTAKMKTTGSGKPFLDCDVSDRSGVIKGVFWDFNDATLASEAAGCAVFLRGNISMYNDLMQVVLVELRKPEQGENVDISKLVPTAPIVVDEELGKINSYIASMTDPDYKKIAVEMLKRHKNTFKQIPAAKGVHHAFVNGLLMHTGTMLAHADCVAALYPVINRDLLFAGVMCHDLAKDREYKFTELGLATDFTVDGNLLGHLVMGAEEIGRVGRELNLPEEKIMLLQHMLLSHHGQPEWGAAVYPKIVEADALHLIDNMDAHMESYRETLEGMNVGEMSTTRVCTGQYCYKHG